MRKPSGCSQPQTSCTLARTGVDYDYRGDVIDSHAPEMPTRFAKQLAQLVRGAVLIGMPRDQAMRLAVRCARDSMPPLRLAILDDIAANPYSSTAEVRRRLGKPRSDDRPTAPGAPHPQFAPAVEEEEAMHMGRDVTRWRYTLARGSTRLRSDIQCQISAQYPQRRKREGAPTHP